MLFGELEWLNSSLTETDALHRFYYIIPFLKPFPIFKGLAKIKNLLGTPLPKIDTGYNYNSFGNIICSRKGEQALVELFEYVYLCVCVCVSIGDFFYLLVGNSTWNLANPIISPLLLDLGPKGNFLRNLSILTRSSVEIILYNLKIMVVIMSSASNLEILWHTSPSIDFWRILVETFLGQLQHLSFKVN